MSAQSPKLRRVLIQCYIEDVSFRREVLEECLPRETA